MRNCKIELFGPLPEFSDDTLAVHFLGVAALAADQEDSRVRMLWMRTGQVGVVGGQSMHQALLE